MMADETWLTTPQIIMKRPSSSSDVERDDSGDDYPSPSGSAGSPSLRKAAKASGSNPKKAKTTPSPPKKRSPPSPLTPKGKLLALIIQKGVKELNRAEAEPLVRCPSSVSSVPSPHHVCNWKADEPQTGLKVSQMRICCESMGKADSTTH